MEYDRMKICMMIGKQAGIVGLLTVLAKKIDVASVASKDNMSEKICKNFNIPFFSSIYDKKFINIIKKSDLFISVHGKEIVSAEFLNSINCINVHPCLYRYKGADPINRLLKDGETKASVGIHYMTEKVDEGDVILEEFIDISNLSNATEVYNYLYPYYSSVLFKSIDIIRNKRCD